MQNLPYPKQNIIMLLPLFLASSIAIGSGLPIVSLPGLPEMPKWKMDSGYVTYTSPMQKSQHHTFVWIAESQNDPSTDPILFWSNGGPGCSGLFGMGFENGPFQAQSDGGLLPSEYSWNKRATVVWFEQPAGVGFSYSDNPADYNNYNDTVSSTDNAAFLTAFFAAYPKYQSLKLFLTSESCECVVDSPPYWLSLPTCFLTPNTSLATFSPPPVSPPRWRKLHSPTCFSRAEGQRHTPGNAAQEWGVRSR